MVHKKWFVENYILFIVIKGRLTQKHDKCQVPPVILRQPDAKVQSKSMWVGIMFHARDIIWLNRPG